MKPRLMGAAMAEHLSPMKKTREACAEVRRWHNWLAVMASEWPCDTEARDDTRTTASQEAPAQRDAKRNLNGLSTPRRRTRSWSQAGE